MLKPAAFLALTLTVSGCVDTTAPDFMSFMPGGKPPAMAWDHRPEADQWTVSTMSAVASEDDALADLVPEDIDTWCPGYAKASIGERRAFWSGLLSAVARYESSWNPRASGGGGRYIGVMQISPRSAANYGCEADTAAELKDGAANLQCAVEMVAYHVERDGVVAGRGTKGVGRDWMPLRDAGKRAAIADWTRAQSYCQK
ncbi:MAG: lytic transglycosylase domain-containing protein [Rhodobacteraceae bacterium]|uniref:transglycosylase SLT domain-containing protein n=1 Tax=Tabrizicola sp. SY72 TaxID=2741673 RepID=UPI001573E57D|nr:transglycosylase SLT domain-containing protein [Tabrizicola sp. SY72]MBL9055704.1 lytic transglycosylase domain-containing protein [Paracoccaceae bacterium]NTT85384.1 lytic transglycosylase domain-containing protein [Tabrizicola sp. SY72]